MGAKWICIKYEGAMQRKYSGIVLSYREINEDWTEKQLYEGKVNGWRGRDTETVLVDWS